jgi:hypothetical protein
MPGIDEDMLGAIQQAPQPKRQSILTSLNYDKGAHGIRKGYVKQLKLCA